MARLLLIVPTLSSYEAFLSDFAEAALLAGHQVHVATQMQLLDGRAPEHSKRLSNRVRFHAVEMPRGASVAAVFRSAKEIRSLVTAIQPAWIQAHFSVAALVLAVAKRPGWPYTSCIIQGLACTMTTGFDRWISWAGERYAMSKLDEMWVLTEDDYAVVKSWNANKAKLQEAPGFGCRLNNFNPQNYGAEWREARMAELSVSADTFTMIYVGRLAAFKGFDKVAQAYWELKSRGAALQLILLGAFDSRHDAGLSKGEISRLKEDPSVLLPGWQDAVAGWLALADVCVFPSEREGMPVCLMESIAMGVPVVTSDSRGCRHVVRDGVDGVVVGDVNVDKIVNAVSDLMRSDDKLKAMKVGALKHRNSFDRERFIAEQLSNLPAELLR